MLAPQRLQFWPRPRIPRMGAPPRLPARPARRLILCAPIRHRHRQLALPAPQTIPTRPMQTGRPALSPWMDARRVPPIMPRIQLRPCSCHPPRPMAMPLARCPSMSLDTSRYIDSLRTSVTPIMPTPPARRKRRELSPDFTPRRSGRITKNDRGFDSETKAKRVLLHRLGLLGEDEPISAEILEKYTRLFERPLANEVVQAFANFYRWRIPLGLFDSQPPALPRLIAI